MFYGTTAGLQFNLLLPSALSTMKGAVFIVLSAFAIVSENSADNSESLMEAFGEGNRDIALLTGVYVSREILMNLSVRVAEIRGSHLNRK